MRCWLGGARGEGGEEEASRAGAWRPDRVGEPREQRDGETTGEIALEACSRRRMDACRSISNKAVR